MTSKVLHRIASSLSPAQRWSAVGAVAIALSACTGQIGSDPSVHGDDTATTTGGGSTTTGGGVVNGLWEPPPCDPAQVAFTSGRIWLITDQEYVNSVRDVLGITLTGADANISSTGDSTGEFANLSEGGAVFTDNVAANYQTAAINVAKQAVVAATMQSLLGATTATPATDAQLDAFITTKVARLWR